MLEFELDEEQKMLVDAIGRFAETRIRKVYRDAEEDGAIPEDIVQTGWEFGLIPTAIPEENGGFGEYSTITNVLATEELAYGDLAIAFNILVPGLSAIPIMLAGTDAQKSAFLPRFCEPIPPAVTAALSEPKIQFNPRKLSTSAILDGDTYILNGAKCLVPLADSADVFLIYANEDGMTQAFIIPRATEGLAVCEREKLMGINALPTFRLAINDCRIQAENRLGGDAGIDFDLILNHGRVALGAAAVGLAKAGYDYALNYAKNRVQFDEPIAHRQSIAFLLADMAIEVDAARLLVWETAWKLDQGEDATREATLMKSFVDDVVLQIADRAVQTLGGYGYVREYPVELWLRNARGFASFDGLAIA
ncbi:MAG: acyl-CoA dehydrogenase family protein [Candidatus Promineifilaceae bacterium]